MDAFLSQTYARGAPAPLVSITQRVNYFAPGAGAGAVMFVEVCGKIQLYFGELKTMKWIRKATTRPAAKYAPSTARKL